MEKRKKDDNQTENQKDKRLTIDFWKEVLQGETPPLFLEIRKKTFLNKTRFCFEIFNYLIRTGIRSWEHQNGTTTPLSEGELKNKLIYLLPNIYEQTNLIRNRTASFTSRRVKSWLKKDRHLKKFFALIKKEIYIFEWDKEGNIPDFALRRPGSSNLHNPIDSTDNPQKNLIENKENSISEGILNKLQNSGKHGPVHRKIMDMLLDGIDVGKDDAETLGVKKRQVNSLVYQARLKTCKIAAEEGHELAEKIDFKINQAEKKRKLKKLIELITLIYIIAVNEKIKSFLSIPISNLSNHKEKKSTKKKNGANRPDNEDDTHKHGPIREWRPENGWITISYEEALKLKKNKHPSGDKKEALANQEDQKKCLFLF